MFGKRLLQLFCNGVGGDAAEGRENPERAEFGVVGGIFSSATR